MVMEGLGDQLLAGAALAEDEHVALRRRGQADEVEDLLHRRALADDLVEAVALLELLLERAVLARQAALFEAFADGEQDLFVLERLGDVVESADAHRFDGALDRGVRRDHDHHLLGIARAQLLQDLHARHAGEHEIEQHEIDRFALGKEQRLLAGAGGDRAQTLAPEERPEDVLEHLFVVDDEDVGHARSCAASAALAALPAVGRSTTNRQPRSLPRLST